MEKFLPNNAQQKISTKQNLFGRGFFRNCFGGDFSSTFLVENLSSKIAWKRCIFRNFLVDNLQAFFVTHFSSHILLHISFGNKFVGALGLYNLWGLGFIKLMGC